MTKATAFKKPTSSSVPPPCGKTSAAMQGQRETKIFNSFFVLEVGTERLVVVRLSLMLCLSTVFAGLSTPAAAAASLAAFPALDF